MNNNVKFLEFRANYWKTECIFEIHPKIAEDIRVHTHSSEKTLNYYLNADNHFLYLVETKDTERLKPIVETIERISNLKDPEYVINHLVTDSGTFNDFYKVRELLEKELGLMDRKMQTEVMKFFSDMEYLRFNFWS